MHRACASLPASALLSILKAWRAAGWPSARASALSTAFCTAEYLGRYLGRAQWIHRNTRPAPASLSARALRTWRTAGQPVRAHAR